MILADKIMNLRKQMNLSQEQLAEKLSVSRQSVSKWESAQAMPDTGKIIQLAEIFGVTTDYLLKDDIGEAEYTESSKDFDTPLRRVSLEEANEFLEKNEKKASSVALAVLFFVLCPVPLLFFAGVDNALTDRLDYNTGVAIGVISLLILVAIGAAIMLKSNMRMEKFEYLQQEPVETMYGVTGMVNARKENYSEKHTMQVILGVVLSVLSAVPVLYFALVHDEDASFAVYGVIGLLFMVAAGVYILIKTSILWNGFQTLLQEGDYTIEKKKFDKKFSSIGLIYWLSATALYFLYSFVTMDWERSWIVWPIAGIVFPIVVMVFKINQKKQ